MSSLGTINKVEIQKIWSMEPQFSSWLAEEENLAKLGETLGLEELELKGIEYPVGHTGLILLHRKHLQRILSLLKTNMAKQTMIILVSCLLTVPVSVPELLYEFLTRKW